MLEYMKIWRKDTVTLKDLELGKSCIVTKVLGEGQLEKKLTVQAHKFSKNAIDKINESGSKAEVI